MANEFKEYTAKGSTVRVRTSEGKETVNTVSGPVDVAEGDIVVATNNPNIFDVLSPEQWNSTEYSTPPDTADSSASSSSAKSAKAAK